MSDQPWVLMWHPETDGTAEATLAAFESTWSAKGWLYVKHVRGGELTRDEAVRLARLEVDLIDRLGGIEP